jgi:glycosyltransferase involved in cell wall biosynthesis
LERFVDAEFPDGVLIFVDDGSSDNTPELLNQIRTGRESRVVVLTMAANSGKAEAVRRGMQYAFDRQFQYAGFWDADLATPLSEISQFVALLDERPELDMVFGARVKLLGRRVERRASRHYIGRAFATVVSFILKLPIYDTQCGAKLFRTTPQVRALFQKPFLSRWIFDVEMIARYAIEMGTPEEASRRIYEFPLHAWADIRGSKLKSFDFVKASLDLLRIYRTYRIRGRAPRSGEAQGESDRQVQRPLR